jgi:hypothetical protein
MAFYFNGAAMNLFPMRRALGAAACLMAIHAAALADDPLWARSQALLLKNKGLVAQTIATKLDTGGFLSTGEGGYETVLQRFDITGRPVRGAKDEATENNPDYKASKLDMALANHFANNPEHLFENASGVTRLADQQVNGETLAVFDVRAEHVLKRTLPVAMRVWVRPDSGAPVKADGMMEVPAPFGPRAPFKVRYTTDSAGRTLPTQVWLEYDYLTTTRNHIKFDHTLSNWKQRP